MPGSRTRWQRAAIVFVVLGAACSSPADTPPDDPSTTFTVGGVVRGLEGSGLVLRDRISGREVQPESDGPFTLLSDVPGGATYEVVVASQPTSPIQACSVVDGSGEVTNANVTDIGVDCDEPDGDGSFGDGGRVTAQVAGGATAMAIQGDGKIVVAGESKLLRFNDDGSVDAGFGAGGQSDFTFPDLPAIFSNLPQGVAIDDAGRIVVAGYARSGLDARDYFVVARYQANGSLDGAFGIGGRVVLDLDAQAARGRGVALTGGGSIVVAGEAVFGLGNFDSADVVVAKLTTDGALDESFGDHGLASTHFSHGSVEMHGVGLGAGGRIYVAGSVSPIRKDSVAVAVVALLPDGSPDSTFAQAVGTPGQLWTNLGGLSSTVRAHAMVVQQDGTIAVAGEIEGAGTARFMIARIRADGSAGAPVLTPFSDDGDRALGIAELPTGDLVAVGRTHLFGASDFALALYGAVGDPITSVQDFFHGIDEARAVAIAPDGTIIAAGAVQDGTSSVLGMARVDF